MTLTQLPSELCQPAMTTPVLRRNLLRTPANSPFTMSLRTLNLSATLLLASTALVAAAAAAATTATAQTTQQLPAVVSDAHITSTINTATIKSIPASTISTGASTPAAYTVVSPDARRANAEDTSGEEDAPDLINNDFVQIFFCLIYATVFVLGVFGNVLVCYVVLRNRAMQTVTNIFITNLALSDILLCVLAVPFTPLYTFMGRWAFGRTLCHLVSFAQGCSIYISTLTLTSIAIDRYFVIIYPFHPRMKLSTCISIIVSIWVISLLATLPYGMYMKVVTDVSIANSTWAGVNSTPATGVQSFGGASNLSATQNATSYAVDDESTTDYTTYVISPAATSPAEAYMQLMTASVSTAAPDAASNSASTTTYCEENWPSEQYRKVFGSVTTILQFVLPFVIISICYTWVSVKLNARARAKPGSKSSRREEADRDRKKRTNRMLIAMVAVFGLSWLPINVVNIFDDFYEKSNEWRFYTLFFFVAHSIAMSSTCYNPFLYAWLNENFRKEFKHVLPCFNPSNNNIINITRGYNRSDRNTCGPRLHHGNGGGVGSIDIDDGDENGITQETSLHKDKMMIIPREATYGNGSGSGSKSPGGPLNAALVHNRHVDILLNDKSMRRQRRNTTDDDFDSGDEQTVEMRFCETPFVSSDNATGISMLETTSSSNDGGADRRCN